MLQTACQVNAQEFFEKDIIQINAGMLAEQFVGQELIANDVPYLNRPLLFWEGEKAGQAEVDFVISVGSAIVPIEVKSGATGTLRSLRSFLNQKRVPPLGVRISEHPLSLHDHILSVPLYLTHALPQLITETIQNHV